jgi:hypothetical protein
MGGGLMQLVAYGAQDIYLTGNPQITFFKVVYRRHTNFSMEAIEQTFNGTASLGGSVSATISRNGDLVHRMYIVYNAKTCIGSLANTTILANNFSHNLINEVDLEIGGQRIDRHYGHWLQVWSDLTEPNTIGINQPVDTNGKEPQVAATLFQNMTYNHQGNTAAVTGSDAPTSVTVPLQFWFCRNPGLALPLIALQYHEVKVKITFSKFTNAMKTSGTTGGNLDLTTHKLWADYIYLDTDERRRFAQVSHEYLIEQLQFQDESSALIFDLNFNHPVKEIIWTKPAEATVTNAISQGSANAIALENNNFNIKLNGHDRFAERNRLYFTRTQVWEHHSGYGGVTARDSIAVYSFALKPEEHQPSGTCNFSRIDNAQLIQGVTEQALRIYAVNYNVLRIMSGMGGLAYSN